MTSDQSRRIDELTADLDEAKTTVDELEDNPPADVQIETVQKLKSVLEQATDAADELENQKD
jgi:hypothetical protein